MWRLLRSETGDGCLSMTSLLPDPHRTRTARFSTPNLFQKKQKIVGKVRKNVNFLCVSCHMVLYVGLFCLFFDTCWLLSTTGGRGFIRRRPAVVNFYQYSSTYSPLSVSMYSNVTCPRNISLRVKLYLHWLPFELRHSQSVLANCIAVFCATYVLYCLSLRLTCDSLC